MMKIVVLVKQVPDTWDERRLDPTTWRADRTGELVIDEISERAIEVALAHKDSDKGTEVVVVTMGPPDAGDALRKALAMGADRALHIVDDALAGADVMSTATVLAAALEAEGFDLLVAGDESTDGHGGVVPALLAEHLGTALLSALSSIRVEAGEVAGTRTSDAGTARVRAALPAIVSITEQFPQARFASLRGVFAAKRKPLACLGVTDLQLAPVVATSSVLSAAERPARSGGVTVADDGAAARRLADFLTERHLI
jgi:electron transfer flavoprotein beta subunit